MPHIESDASHRKIVLRPDCLQDQVVIVTGASSGIGAATAQAFSKAGALVVLTGRKRSGLEDTYSKLTGPATIVVGDLASATFCDEVVAVAISRYGRLDCLANVAGVITRADVTETTDADWRSVMEVNLDAVFFMCRAGVRAMRSGGGGSIINLASNVGLVATTDLAAYCASKGAVVSLTKAMALDHATDNIRVNALCPGAVETPMLTSGRAGTVSPDEIRQANLAAIPQGRIATSEEIADAVVMLATDLASHITGVALPIDGGYVAQ